MDTRITSEADRERIAAELDRRIAEPVPEFSTVDPEYIRDYQRSVRRWIHCAPVGALVLLAPLQGWDGKPLGGRPELGVASRLLMNADFRRIVEEKYGETAFERASRIHLANAETS